MEEIVRSYLDARYIPRRSRGYQFIIKAVIDTIRDPTTPYHFMRWEHEESAASGVPAANIDRVMRYALSKSDIDMTLCEFVIEASIQVNKLIKESEEKII